MDLRQFEFKDFSIEILASRDDEFDVRVVSDASGELSTKIKLTQSVDEILKLLGPQGGALRGGDDARAVNFKAEDVKRDEPWKAIGRELFKILFASPDVARAFAECMTDAKDTDGVRLKLTMNTRDPAVANLARLPWETLHDSSKYKTFSLNGRQPIVRYLEVPKPFQVDPFHPPLRILVVSANPRNDIALEQERKNLEQALGSDSRIETDFIESATIQAVSTALATADAEGRDYHVVHYMGHGDYHQGKGVLLLHKEGGGIDYVDAETFNTALQAADSIRLVFLNACNTAQSGGAEGADPFAGVATALVFEGVPAVVAMQRPIPDRAAIVLAKNFYPNIAKGWPVDAAVSEGRRQMFFDDRNSMDWAIPVLFMRSPNGVLFDFADSPVPEPAAPSRPSATAPQAPFEGVAPVPVEKVKKAAEVLPPPPPTPAPADRVDPPPEPVLPAPARRNWKVAAAAVAAVAAGLAAWAFLVGPLRRPDPPARVVLAIEPALIKMGERTEAEFLLRNEAGALIEGDALSRYDVEWLPDAGDAVRVVALDVRPESKSLKASVEGLKPSVAQITARLRGFDNLSGRATVMVTPSDEALKAFVAEFGATRKQDRDPAVSNATLVGSLQAFSTNWPWIDDYFDEILGFADEDRVWFTKIPDYAKKLEEADRAFESVKKDVAGGPRRSLLSSEEKWKKYLADWGAVRPSPSLEEARGAVESIAQQKASGAYVLSMETCAPAERQNLECGRTRDAFGNGQPVVVAFRYMTPVRDSLSIQWVPLDERGNEMVNGAPSASTGIEAGRAEPRRSYKQFTASVPRTHAVVVKNGHGEVVWRQEVPVR